MLNLPKDFEQDMKDILKEEYSSFLLSYDKPSFKGLRLNTIKIKDSSLLPFNLTNIPWCKTGYYYSEQDTPGKHVYHEMGLYYIQEPSAMAPVEELDVQEGDFVLDLCAAPGGKSTQIAAKLNGTGLLISNEIIPSRAKILSSNIERMGIKNAICLNEDPKNVAKHFKNFFDKILIDAPCSGEGMFRKNEEAISEWSKDNVIMCANRQLDILETIYPSLKDGGRIVYSTCTFSKEENEGVIEKFLSNHPEFHLVKPINTFKGDLMQRIYPHLVNGEGHFFAILQKDGSLQKSEIKIKDLKQDPAFLDFKKKYLNVDIKYNLKFGDNLYLSPYVNLDGLKVVRAGLHLGELKKNRFEPSHSLALALSSQDFKNVINLSSQDKEVTTYLQGNSIPTDINGWGIVAVDGYPLGLIKGDGYQAKNHYPKGLRIDF